MTLTLFSTQEKSKPTSRQLSTPQHHGAQVEPQVSSSWKNFILPTDLLTIRSNSPGEIIVEIIVLKKIGWSNTLESLIIKTATHILKSRPRRSFLSVMKGEFAQTSTVQLCHPAVQQHFPQPCPVSLHSGGNLCLGLTVPAEEEPPPWITTKQQALNGLINELII